MKTASFWAATLIGLIWGTVGLAAIEQPSVDALVPGARSQIPAAESSTRVNQAVENFRQGQIEQCFALLKAAVNEQPNLPPARLMLAQLFLSNRRFTEGRANLEQVAREHPQHPGVYVTFGELALIEGGVTVPMLFFQKAGSLPIPDDWTTRQKERLKLQINAGLATVAQRREDWKWAQSLLSQRLKLEPTNGKVRQRLARALFELGKAKEAYQQLQQAEKDDGTVPSGALLMGGWYEAKGQDDAAAKWLAYAAKKSRDDATVQRSYAAFLLARNRVAEAKVQADAAARIDPKSNQVRMLRGLIARAQQQYDEAERLFTEAYRETSGGFEASNQLALVLVEQDDESKRGRALQMAEFNVRQHGRNPNTLSTLGWVYYRLGRLDEAEQALGAAVRSGAIQAETAYFLARVLTERNQAEEAAKAVKALKGVIEKSRIFVLRQEAQRWLEQQDDRQR